MSDILLDIKNLNIVYSTTDGVVRALNDANLQIRRGEAQAKQHWRAVSCA